MQWISLASDIIGVLGGIFALLAWIQSFRIREELKHEKQRINKKVKVILSHGKDAIELPVELRRAELSRAEILGRIGMLPMRQKGARFSLAYLSEPEFLRRLNEVVEADGNTILTIPCNKDEFEQFDFKTA